jgi:hypothetical protein
MPTIITADNLVVGGNIVVGGFLQQGTDLSATVVIPTSLTISGIEVSVIDNEGLRVDFSGAGLAGLSICGTPFTGGGGWNGEATTDLSMNGFGITNVNYITISDGANNLRFSASTGVIDFGTATTGDGVVTINPTSTFVGIGSTAPTSTENLFVPNAVVGTQLAVGTTTLSGALNVTGDAYISSNLDANIVNVASQLAVGTTLSGALNVSGDVYVQGSVYTASSSVYIGDVKLSSTAANQLSVSGGLVVSSTSGLTQTCVGNVVYASSVITPLNNGGSGYAIGDVVTVDTTFNTTPFNSGPEQRLVVDEVDGGVVTAVSISGIAYYSNRPSALGEVTTTAVTGSGSGLALGLNTANEPFGTAPTATRQQPLVQTGTESLVAGTATVILPFLYGNTNYSIAIAPLSDNSGFWISNIALTQFVINAAQTDTTESWSFRWTTFGNVEYID